MEENLEQKIKSACYWRKYMLILDPLYLDSDELIGCVEITSQTHDQGHLGCMFPDQSSTSGSNDAQ